MLYKLREEKNQNNNLFIKNISNVEVIFDDIHKNLYKYKICPRQCYFRIQEKNKNEYLIFLTTPFKNKYEKRSSYILFLDAHLSVVQNHFIRFLILLDI